VIISFSKLQIIILFTYQLLAWFYEEKLTAEERSA